MEGTKHPSIFLPKLYSRIYGLHLLSVLGEWNMLHNLHFVDFHEFVSASEQPSRPECVTSHCGTSCMGGHSGAFPFLLLLLQSSIKSHLERGVPGASAWSSGLAGRLVLVCTDRITQAWDVENQNLIIIMKISYLLWKKRENWIFFVPSHSSTCFRLNFPLVASPSQHLPTSLETIKGFHLQSF